MAKTKTIIDRIQFSNLLNWIRVRSMKYSITVQYSFHSIITTVVDKHSNYDNSTEYKNLKMYFLPSTFGGNPAKQAFKACCASF
jgi:hypothetical protein